VRQIEADYHGLAPLEMIYFREWQRRQLSFKTGLKQPEPKNFTNEPADQTGDEFVHTSRGRTIRDSLLQRFNENDFDTIKSLAPNPDMETAEDFPFSLNAQSITDHIMILLPNANNNLPPAPSLDPSNQQPPIDSFAQLPPAPSMQQLPFDPFAIAAPVPADSAGNPSMDAAETEFFEWFQSNKDGFQFDLSACPPDEAPVAAKALHPSSSVDLVSDEDAKPATVDTQPPSESSPAAAAAAAGASGTSTASSADSVQHFQPFHPGMVAAKFGPPTANQRAAEDASAASPAEGAGAPVAAISIALLLLRRALPRQPTLTLLCNTVCQLCILAAKPSVFTRQTALDTPMWCSRRPCCNATIPSRVMTCSVLL